METLLCWPDKIVQFFLFFQESFGLNAFFTGNANICQMVDTLQNMEE